MGSVKSNDVDSLLRQQVVLARFGELALRSDDLNGILTEACRLVGEALGTDLAKVMELVDGGTVLFARAGVGWNPGVVGTVTIKVEDNTSEGMALKTGEPMISPDIETETRFSYPHFLVENSVRAVANVIIIGAKDNPPFGILQIDSREPREFTENDTTFLKGYANLIAAAVDRLAMIDELRERDASSHHAQRMEAIGCLAAGVAHDFNNILQSVCGSLELVLDESTIGTSSHEFLELALKSAMRGASLTDHLLSYARKQVLTPRPIEVASFLTDMCHVLTRTLPPNIEVKAFVVSRQLTVDADSGHFETALLNLAINASHAMEDGGVLTLKGEEASESGRRYASITISDTGPGMDHVTMARAFEPFFTTKGVKGSGLGLSMVEGFAKQSGGDVRLSSAPGKGTAVEMRLPAVEPVNAGIIEPPAFLGSQNFERILLVDDAVDVLKTMSLLLQRSGFHVVRVTNAEAALVELKAGARFDALITDYAMPGINGTQLIARAREIQRDLPALIITGFGTGSSNTASLPDGVSVLRKPVDRKQLVGALRKTLELKPYL